MEKLDMSKILIKDAKLTAVKLDEKSPSVNKLIDETRQKQAEVLKLKEVDEEGLRMVIQL